ncbi:Uncharacterised protein [uncultured Blautia sp.]|nr:Uncharacterised protein [uncultured Blautia sp.]
MNRHQVAQRDSAKRSLFINTKTLRGRQDGNCCGNALIAGSGICDDRGIGSRHSGVHPAGSHGYGIHDNIVPHQPRFLIVPDTMADIQSVITRCAQLRDMPIDFDGLLDHV